MPIRSRCESDQLIWFKIENQQQNQHDYEESKKNIIITTCRTSILHTIRKYVSSSFHFSLFHLFRFDRFSFFLCSVFLQRVSFTSTNTWFDFCFSFDLLSPHVKSSSFQREPFQLWIHNYRLGDSNEGTLETLNTE